MIGILIRGLVVVAGVVTLVLIPPATLRLLRAWFLGDCPREDATPGCGHVSGQRQWAGGPSRTGGRTGGNRTTHYRPQSPRMRRTRQAPFRPPS